MHLDCVQRLTAVRSFEYDGFPLQLLQDSVQRLANQCVIVDNENFHKELSVTPFHGDSTEKNIASLARLWRGLL
jgi:hypothetical protein